jgi:hypothetical protein
MKRAIYLEIWQYEGGRKYYFEIGGEQTPPFDGTKGGLSALRATCPNLTREEAADAIRQMMAWQLPATAGYYPAFVGQGIPRPDPASTRWATRRLSSLPLPS